MGPAGRRQEELLALREAGRRRPEALPHRQQWAVETMRIEPDDRVLEIGCGHGVAAGLICQSLKSGRFTAIDRSASMIRMASSRNANYVKDGLARFVAADLDWADLPERHFTKIFSVNVSLFWLGTNTGQLDKVRRLLAPGGRLYVFNEPPKPERVNAIGSRAAAALETVGFQTSCAETMGQRGLTLTCVTGVIP